MRVELLAQPFFVHFADRGQRQAVHLNKAIRQFEIRHALLAQVATQHHRLQRRVGDDIGAALLPISASGIDTSAVLITSG